MNVVRHQYVRVNLDPMENRTFAERSQVHFVIAVHEEASLAVVPTLHDVQRQVSGRKAKSARHSAQASATVVKLQIGHRDDLERRATVAPTPIARFCSDPDLGFLL